jgi:hypothetical protein
MKKRDEPSVWVYFLNPTHFKLTTSCADLKLNTVFTLEEFKEAIDRELKLLDDHPQRLKTMSVPDDCYEFLLFTQKKNIKIINDTYSTVLCVKQLLYLKIKMLIKMRR